MAGNASRIARAVYRACSVPGQSAPYDRLSLKIYYPALPDDGDEQRNAGVVPVDPDGAPYPVIIVLPGINVGPESYAWFANELAKRGFVVATYSMIAEEMPGYISLTPGLDLGAISPDTFGTRPSSTALGPLIETLRAENTNGLLAGSIDLDNIILVGHSAGGSVALYNANPDWFAGLRGAVAIAAHAAPSTALGFAENSMLELPDQLPLMLIAGNRDGVIASSGHRYGDTDQDPLARIRQTFEGGVRSNRGDCWLIELDGANHFSFVGGDDHSTGRGFLDWSEQADNGTLKALYADLVEQFSRDATSVGSMKEHELIAAIRSK